MHYTKSILILLLGLNILPLWGQALYEIDSKYPVHDLQDELMYIAEDEKSFQPKEIILDSNLVFVQQDSAVRYLSVGKIYWGKIALLTKEDLTGWTLNFEERFEGLPAWNRGNGQIDVYGFVNGVQIFHKKTGVAHPK